jgi:hypothetical protein
VALPPLAVLVPPVGLVLVPPVGLVLVPPVGLVLVPPVEGSGFVFSGVQAAMENASQMLVIDARTLLIVSILRLSIRNDADSDGI